MRDGPNPAIVLQQLAQMEFAQMEFAQMEFACLEIAQSEEAIQGGMKGVNLSENLSVLPAWMTDLMAAGASRLPLALPQPAQTHQAGKVLRKGRTRKYQKH